MAWVVLSPPDYLMLLMCDVVSTEGTLPPPGVFGRNCQQCHNSRGKRGKSPQLVKGAWGPGGANSDAYMFEIISNGRAGIQMGGFGLSLKQEEIRQVIAFMRQEALRVKAVEKNAVDEDEIPYY